MDSSTAYALIAAAFVVGWVLGRVQSREAPAPPASPDLGALETVRGVLETEGKIAAIKAYRERTGVGLRDAKLAVETLE